MEEEFMKIGLSGIYLSDFVTVFNELESTMYAIQEDDFDDEITSKDRKLLNEVVDLSKYIAETYSKNEF